MRAVRKSRKELEIVGWKDPPNELKTGEANPPPNKVACFELNVKLNNTWALDQDQVEYAKFIQNFAPTYSNC